VFHITKSSKIILDTTGDRVWAWRLDGGVTGASERLELDVVLLGELPGLPFAAQGSELRDQD
jgi:hypothetical protein